MRNKLLFTFIAIVMTALTSYSQSQTWQNLIIGDVVSINFPAEHDHMIIDSTGKEVYTAQIEGCRFMVAVSPNVISNYKAFLKLDENKQIESAQQILDGVAKGKVARGNQHLISQMVFKSGRNVGMDIIYKSNELDGTTTKKKFSTLLLIGATLYMFDCWYIDGNEHEALKEKFLKSILLKN